MIRRAADTVRDHSVTLGTGAALVAADQIAAFGPLVEKYGAGAVVAIAFLVELRSIARGLGRLTDIVADHGRRLETLESDREPTEAIPRRQRQARPRRRTRAR